jgi:hypothetical protein
MASVAGPLRVQHAVSTHPASSSRGPAVQPSGVQPVRCPVTWVHRPDPASGRLVSTRPASSRPVSSRLVSTPSVRTRPSRPRQAVAVGPGSVRRAPCPRARVEVPVGRVCRRPARASAEGRGRPGRGRRCRGRASVSGVGGDLAGLGEGGGACPLSDQAGQVGVGSARGWRLRGGHESRRQPEVAAPAAWLPSWAGWATTVRGGRGACRAGGRARRGRWACRPGLGVRPQRGPGWQRARPACG